MCLNKFICAKYFKNILNRISTLKEKMDIKDLGLLIRHTKDGMQIFKWEMKMKKEIW